MAAVKPSGYRWRQLRARFRSQCHAAHARCWLCGGPIDWDAAPNTPASFEVDHALPRSTHPELAWEPANFRPSHVSCNRSRGHRPHPRAGWVPAAW
jgi:5-methylcytosine-specific restriction endonuclease McrA